MFVKGKFASGPRLPLYQLELFERFLCIGCEVRVSGILCVGEIRHGIQIADIS